MKTTVLLLLLTAVTALGARLIWEPSQHAAGYRVYHETNPTATFTNFGETITTNLPLPRLSSGTHYFYVTAFSTNGIESGPSSLVLEPVPAAPQIIKIVVP